MSFDRNKRKYEIDNSPSENSLPFATSSDEDALLIAAMRGEDLNKNSLPFVMSPEEDALLFAAVGTLRDLNNPRENENTTTMLYDSFQANKKLHTITEGKPAEPKKNVTSQGDSQNVNSAFISITNVQMHNNILPKQVDGLSKLKPIFELDPPKSRLLKDNFKKLRDKITKTEFLNIWNQDPNIFNWFSGCPMQIKNSGSPIKLSDKGLRDVFLNVMQFELDPPIVQSMIKDNQKLISTLNELSYGHPLNSAISNYILSKAQSKDNYEFLKSFIVIFHSKEFRDAFRNSICAKVGYHDKSEYAKFLRELYVLIKEDKNPPTPIDPSVISALMRKG